MVNDKQRLKIGVCGIGSIGFRHARLLSQRDDVTLALCDTTPEFLENARPLPNIQLTTNSFDDLLDSGLDGLVVATPDHLHIRQAEAACRRGVAVLVEKPVAENTAQAERLRDAIGQTNGRVLVGYPLRYNAIFLEAKRMVDAGEIGTPVSFHIMLGSYDTLVVAKNRFNSALVNKLFVDYSHEWDYLQWFLGKVRSGASICHQSGNLELSQRPNVVDAVLELESGISGTAHLDYVQTPGNRCFTIIGDKGTIVIDAVKGEVVIKGGGTAERVIPVAESFDGMLSKQHAHFIDVINGDADVQVTLDDGINALRVADALVRASENRSWENVAG